MVCLGFAVQVLYVIYIMKKAGWKKHFRLILHPTQFRIQFYDFMELVQDVCKQFRKSCESQKRPTMLAADGLPRSV